MVDWIYTGAHNDNEEEGKGRSANHPRERLKFQFFSRISKFRR